MDSNETIQKDWKYYLGLTLLGLSCLPLVTVELVFLLPLSKTQAVSFAAVYLGLGEGSFLLAAALLGKPFLQAVKAKIKGFFVKGWESAPAGPISKTRHYFGVTLFLISFLPYGATEIMLLCGSPGEIALRTLLVVLLLGDLMCIVSLLVLGEEFWHRLKHLFEWPGGERQVP